MDQIKAQILYATYSCKAGQNGGGGHVMSMFATLLYALLDYVNIGVNKVLCVRVARTYKFQNAARKPTI